MKTKLLRLALCAFVAALPMGAWADIDFGTEATVNSRTLWIFNDQSSSYSSISQIGTTGLYARGNAARGTIGFEDQSDVSSYTFSNGYRVESITKSAIITRKGNRNATYDCTAGNIVTSATDNSNHALPSIAFNAEVEGTCYVYVKKQSSYPVNLRFYDGTSTTFAAGSTGEGCEEIKLTSTKKGVFYLHPSTNLDYGTITVYAILFVPTPCVTTKWTFEEYVPNVNMFGDSKNQDSKEYVGGLYLHTRDADSENHCIMTANVTINNSIYGDADIISQTKTYRRGSSYPTISIMSGDNNGAASSATSASQNLSYSGIAYQAPSNGTFYYTVYTERDNSHVYHYVNGAKTDNSFNKTSYKGRGGEFSIEVNKGDLICVTTSSSPIYLLEAYFKPVNDAVVVSEKVVYISNAGYATFSSTHNYSLPDGLEAYIVSNVNGTAAIMTPVSEVPACTGVILKGAEGYYTLTSKETTTVDVSKNMLKANIVDYNLPADDDNGNYNYTLAAGPTFKHSDGTGTLAAGKAFLRTTVNVTGDGARSLELDFNDDETTGIKAIETSQYTNDIYFNLAGQRVEKPTKGLYIVNGKKVVIK